MRTIPRFAALMLACAASACANDAGKGNGAASTAQTTDTGNATVAAVTSRATDAALGEWIASALAGADGPPRMALDAGEVRGHTGCNGFSGSYARGDDDALTFGAIVSTKKFCDGEPGASEQRVLHALSESRAATIVGDRMTLRDATGAMLLELDRAR